MARATQTTRYERVKEILDSAAGTSTADYGGVGRFWDLPLDELLDVRVAGVRMIAPEGSNAAKSCCSHASSQSPSGSDSASGSGRGAASGLVRGLRGNSPFDGTHFPQLPWGGSPVSQDDIDFISDWIDDG